MMPADGSPRRDLVIFDCDGVLVDSEPLAIAVLCETLAGFGIDIGPSIAYRRFLGRTWPAVSEILRLDYGVLMGEADVAAMLDRLERRFRSALRPTAGVIDALDRIGPPYCVASSSLPRRLKATLEAVDLLDRFEPHVFSAASVAEGKPAPDLFLHVSARMGIPPAKCIVIEDSPLGIEAARRAGMRVFAFTGGSHIAAADLLPQIIALRPDAVFGYMDELPALLGS